MVSNLIGWWLKDIKCLCLLLRCVEAEKLLVPLRKSSWGKKSAAKQLRKGSTERSPDFPEVFTPTAFWMWVLLCEYCIYGLLFVFPCECIHQLEDLENYLGFVKCGHLPEQNAPRHNSWGQNFCRNKAQAPFPPSPSLVGSLDVQNMFCSWYKLQFSSTLRAPNQGKGSVGFHCVTKDEWKGSEKRLNHQGNN